MGVRQGLLAECDREAHGELEAALTAAARAGDRAALEQLVARHKQPLFALCYGILGHAEDAEDAVQETFLRLLRTFSSYRGDASFRTWLYRIAVNYCLDRKRARRAVESWDDREWDNPRSARANLRPPSPERIALERLQLFEALRNLLPRHRAILLLKEREEWSVAEIAAALDCSPIRVKNELASARRALIVWRRELERGEER